MGPLLLNLGYMADRVRDYIEACPYRENVETVYEPALLGTAGTLLQNRGFFNNEPLMLIHADNLSVFNVRDFIRRHQERPAGCVITMMTFVTDSPRTCGIVELDERGVVTAFHEKVDNPPGNMANGAVYILEPDLFSFLESIRKECIDFSTEVLPHFVGRIATYHNADYHRDIGTVESYHQALKTFEIGSIDSRATGHSQGA